MDKSFFSICTTLDDDPGKSKIQHLQYNTPLLRSRIADLTEKIGVGYFAFDSHTPTSPYQRKKTNPPSPLNSPRTRRVIATTRKIYLSQDDTSTMCGGLTEGLNGGKL